MVTFALKDVSLIFSSCEVCRYLHIQSRVVDRQLLPIGASKRIAIASLWATSDRNLDETTYTVPSQSPNTYIKSPSLENATVFGILYAALFQIGTSVEFLSISVTIIEPPRFDNTTRWFSLLDVSLAMDKISWPESTRRALNSLNPP